MKSTRIVLLLALTFVLLIASIAAMPAAAVPPNQPTVVATANGGELHATWDVAAGARFYTIGWVNLEEYHRMRNAGRDWLDAFTTPPYQAYQAPTPATLSVASNPALATSSSLGPEPRGRVATHPYGRHGPTW